MIAFAIVFVIGGLIALFFVSKKTPKGTVLAIAAVIYVASFAAQGIRIREVVLLTGAARMLGFAGGILGIIDLVRRRSPKAPAFDANVKTPQSQP